LLPPVRLVDVVELLVRVRLSRRPSDHCDPTLARQDLRVAPALHRLLDPLRRNTFLHHLVRYAVKLVRVAQAVDLDQLLAPAVPVRLRLHLVGESAAVDAWRAVLPAQSLVPMEVLHLKTVVIADLFAKGCGRRSLRLAYCDRAALHLGFVRVFGRPIN